MKILLQKGWEKVWRMYFLCNITPQYLPYGAYRTSVKRVLGTSAKFKFSGWVNMKTNILKEFVFHIDPALPLPLELAGR